jgi:YVTN family beta-propeller protein
MLGIKTRSLIIFIISFVCLTLTVIGSAHAEYPAASGPEYAFIANGIGDSITVVDVATNLTVKNLFVAPGPSSVAINPAGTYLFVTCDRDSSISVYNLADFSLVKYISVAGYSPKRISISSSGDMAYILATDIPVLQTKNYLITFDISTMSVTGINSLNSGSITSMVLTGDDSYVIFSDNINKSLIRYNTATHVFDSYNIGAVRPSSSPVDMSVFHDGYSSGVWVLCNDKAYNYDPYNNILQDFASPSPLIIRNITLFAFGSKIDASMFGSSNIVYIVTSSSSPVTITKYSAPGIIKWNCTLPSMIYWIKVSNDGTKLYAAEGMTQKVKVIDTATGTVLYTINTGEFPRYIAINPVLSSQATGQYVKINVRTLSRMLPLTTVNISVYDSAERLIYTGGVDSTGSVTFYLNALTRYGFHITSAEGIDYWEYLIPSESSYQINVPLSDIFGIHDLADQFLGTADQGKVSYYTNAELNTGTNVGTFNSYYEDTGLNTKSVTFSLYKNNSTIGGSPTLVSTQSYTLARSGNVIVNGGFETGDLTGFTTSNTEAATVAANPDYVYSGNYCLLIYKTGYTTGNVQVRSNASTVAAAGQTWTVSGQVIGTPEGTTYIGINPYYANGTSLPWQNIAITSNANTYTKNSGMFTLPPDTATIKLLIYRAGNIGLRFDDLTLSSNSINHTFTANNAAGNSYYIKIDAVQTDGTTKTYYMPVTMPGPVWLAGLLPLTWYWYLAFLPCLLIAGAGVFTKKGLIGLTITGWTALANVAGWWTINPITGGSNLTQAAMWSIVAVLFLISIIMIVLEAERYK